MWTKNQSIVCSGKYNVHRSIHSYNVNSNNHNNNNSNNDHNNNDINDDSNNNNNHKHNVNDYNDHKNYINGHHSNNDHDYDDDYYHHWVHILYVPISICSFSFPLRSIVEGSNFCWNQTEARVAGTASSQIPNPMGISIDTNNDMYLTGHTIGQVLTCRTNETVRTAVTNNYGDHIDFVCFDKNGNMFANDHNGNRVRRYAKNSTTGTIVAGAGSTVSGSLNFPVGTTIDDNFNLYIADQNNDRIAKLAPNGTTLITVINTNGVVTKVTALLLPQGLSNQIYMSDENNHEVYLWTFGAAMPSVTYTNVIGGTTLRKPRGIKLDFLGNLYVADQGNSRIVMYCVNSTMGIVVAQTGGKPVDLDFDSDMNLYALVDTGVVERYGLL